MPKKPIKENNQQDVKSIKEMKLGKGTETLQR